MRTEGRNRESGSWILVPSASWLDLSPKLPRRPQLRRAAAGAKAQQGAAAHLVQSCGDVTSSFPDVGSSHDDRQSAQAFHSMLRTVWRREACGVDARDTLPPQRGIEGTR